MPGKIQYLIWLLLHNALATNALRHKCGLASNPYCDQCSGNEESSLHCLRECTHAKEVYLRVGM